MAAIVAVAIAELLGELNCRQGQCPEPVRRAAHTWLLRNVLPIGLRCHLKSLSIEIFGLILIWRFARDMLAQTGRIVMKEQKTKLQLEALILERAQATMELDGVTVFGAGTQWQATFSAKPHLMMPYSALFRAIVAEMRGLYDLHRVA